MKRNAIIRIVLWSITLVILLGILCTGIYVPSALNRIRRASVRNTEDFQEIDGNGFTLDAASVRNVEIEWASGSIVIQPMDIGEMYIAEKAQDHSSEPMVWNLQDGTLSIQYCKNPDRVFVFGMDTELECKDLIIQVPRDWQCNSLEIEAASATLEVQDLTIRKMEFDGASGSCKFRNCTVDSLDLDTASGDVWFQGSLLRLECDAVSADITLELTNVPNTLDLDGVSGGLDVTLPAEAGFTVTMETLSGDFESDFDTTQRNGSYVSGNGRCRIDVDGMSGDVTILKGA